MQRQVQRLWLLAYDSFENAPFAAFKTTSASGNQANQVQFRLLNNIAGLKEKQQLDRKLIGAIVADVLVSESQGWITKNTSQEMQDIIDEILES